MSVHAGNRRSASAATESIAKKRARREHVDASYSPITTIGRAMLAIAVCLLVSLVMDAQGIVHAGQGMSDGPMRTATLDVGNPALDIADFTHVGWVWTQLAAARGYSPQPAVPPLLAVGTPAPAARPLHTGTGPKRPIKPAVVAPAPRSRPAFWRPHRRVTRRFPLRLLITGDSLTDYIGPTMVNDLSRGDPVRGFVDNHDGTGLTRPDFVDWSLVARQEVASDNPDAVVVMMGGNDFQNMVVAHGVVLQAGTPVWNREYARRAAICMRIWTQGGKRRVYWLSMPPARDPTWAGIDGQINRALQVAAGRVWGARYLDILGPVTNHGRYTDYVNEGGAPVLVRTPDGVHLNLDGSIIVAHEVERVIRREWRLP